MRSSGKLTTNLIANIINFLVSIAVGIFFTPYLIHHLGVAAYGVIPLAIAFSSYLTVFTLVINASVARFITVAMQRDDIGEANSYFNTSLFASIFSVILLLGPCLWLASMPEHLFHLPAGYEVQSKWLLTFTVGMVMISVLSSPFEVASFCRNRFDFRNMVTITATLIRVGFVVLLFTIAAPSVFYVGLGMFIAAVFSLLASVIIWRKLTPELVISHRGFKSECLRNLAGTGGWIMISQIGTMLLLSIDLLVVNRMFGPDSGGRYASLLQWSILLRGVALTIAGVLAPTIISLYARNEIVEMISYSRKAVKALGLFIALPVGLVSGLSQPLLYVWLGQDFVALAPILTLMTAPLCINLGYMPLHNISQATNNVRVPGIVQLVAGVINLGLAILLAGPLGWGMYGVAAAGLIVLTLKNLVFTPLYCARILGKNKSTFIKELLPLIVVTLLLTTGCWLTSSFINLASWFRLGSFSVFITVGYGILVWFFLISDAEKNFILKNKPKWLGHS